MNTIQNPAVSIAEFILGELDHFKKNFHPQGGERTFHNEAQLKHEPFVGYACIRDNNNNDSRLLICRNYVPLQLKPKGQNVEFASYLSPLGRIIVKKPGEAHAYQIKNRGGSVIANHNYSLIEKDDFTLHLEDGLWDAINNQIVWVEGRLIIRSLRSLLRSGTEIGKQLGTEPTRILRYSVQLPDQAILDQAQDEIFRLPLQTKIRISGAPGTGKTTVLLKRLSQKTKNEFLTHDELNLIRNADWKDGRSWMLFTPSDLLKVYLKEAMAKELLPASDDHVKVYRTFRLELLRDIGFVRVGHHGFFKSASEGSQLMKRSSGGEQIALAGAFGKYLAERYAIFFRDALQKFNNETRMPLAKLSDASQKVLNTALDILAKPLDDVVAFRQAQQRAAGYRKLNEDLNKLLNSVRAVSALENSGVDLLLSRIYRQAQLLPGVLNMLTTADIEIALFPEIPPIVEQLHRDVKNLSEGFTLAHLFRIIPRAYQEFREALEERKRFFIEDSEKSINDRILSEGEQDVLLFHALEFVRELADEMPSNLASIPNDVRAILNRLRVLVCIDEATDFSPLEIACIERLAKQGGGVTICGDLMQRVTEQGLKEWSDLEKISTRFESYDLRISYRQSERLFSIAKDLYRHVRNVEPDFSSAFSKRAGDPPPLVHRNTMEHSTERWLTERICEIHELCGQHLPTTSILVAHQDDVEPLYVKLKPLLRENGVELETSNGGQALGDSARVRIFSVEFIKGLEFEAVFYVGLDRMAEIHRDLIDKYIYVGLSRARSFLGVVVERQFPQRLQCIANHFISGGNWSDGSDINARL